jgi:hypothetical protein
MLMVLQVVLAEVAVVLAFKMDLVKAKVVLGHKALLVDLLP